jgi:FtsP/CotA-like multicopper oxidase with cupredoxin domain
MRLKLAIAALMAGILWLPPIYISLPEKRGTIYDADCSYLASAAVIDDAADLSTQQQQEKNELDEMRKEMGSIKSTIREAQQGMDQVRQQARNAAAIQEVHLIAKEAPWEVAPGVSVNLLMYNAQEPGPVVRLIEGQPARIIVHNQLRTPTSMCFHGMILPHSVNGLPKRDAGLIAPGQTYAFQFVAPPAGTYWYHPQIIHGDEIAKGMYGAIVVEPASTRKSFDREAVLVLGQVNSANKTYFTVNGKSAPLIPPIEVKQGERVHLRVINGAEVACPLYLTGHRFDVVACNGSDTVEPHVVRDSVCVQPGDRYDLEFIANNPGVWSLVSAIPAQSSNDGKFPGGIAVIVRYPEALK